MAPNSPLIVFISVCNEWLRIIPTLDMDVAVFVVHANESRLSINEDNAGIGYARIYRALLKKKNRWASATS